MSHSNSTALERLPDGAIQLCQGRIHAFNRAAGAQFPELAVGDQPPAFLAPALGDQTAGVFRHQGVEYVFMGLLEHYRGPERGMDVETMARTSSELLDMLLFGVARRQDGDSI